MQRCKAISKHLPIQHFPIVAPTSIETVKMSSDSLTVIAFQRGSGATVWEVSTQKAVIEIKDEQATCMDVDMNLELVAIGLRSGQIRFLRFAYKLASVGQVEDGIKAELND
jgi:hypothetical protein